VVVLGNSVGPPSLRNCFPYRARRSFITTLFPQLRIVGIHDYNSDADWLQALDDIIGLTGVKPADVQFYGGSIADVQYFVDDGRRVEIVDRAGGGGPAISATQVRQALAEGRSLEGLVNPLIIDAVTLAFNELPAEFRRS
jgi:hypothetical protein